MEATGFQLLRQALASHVCLLIDQIAIVNAQLPQLSSTLAPTPANTVAPSQSALSLIAHPDKYSGDANSCNGLMVQCSLYSYSQEGVTENTKITQFINLLTDKALVWAIAICTQGESMPPPKSASWSSSGELSIILPRERK